jgi:hypothetical protein
VLASNSIVPLEPSALVCEIVSRPDMKPNVRARPSCSKNRASIDDCGSGQAMRVAARWPHLHLAGHGPALRDSEVAVAAARAREATNVIRERDDRLRFGRYGDIPRAQDPHGPGKRGQGKAARPDGAERAQLAFAERPLPLDEIAGAARRVVLSRSNCPHEQSSAIDPG